MVAYTLLFGILNTSFSIYEMDSCCERVLFYQETISSQRKI